MTIKEKAKRYDEALEKARDLYLPSDSALLEEIFPELIKNDENKKPADNIETSYKYEGLTDFERTLADICIGWTGERLGWKQYIKDNAIALKLKYLEYKM